MCNNSAKQNVSVITNVYGEDDLKLKGRININPPPSDGKCVCCGKHISQLKPFGWLGNPPRDYGDTLLVKNFRGDDTSWGSSWECRDCVFLSQEEYEEVIRANYPRYCVFRRKPPPDSD